MVEVETGTLFFLKNELPFDVLAEILKNSLVDILNEEHWEATSPMEHVEFYEYAKANQQDLSDSLIESLLECYKEIIPHLAVTLNRLCIFYRNSSDEVGFFNLHPIWELEKAIKKDCQEKSWDAFIFSILIFMIEDISNQEQSPFNESVRVCCQEWLDEHTEAWMNPYVPHK